MANVAEAAVDESARRSRQSRSLKLPSGNGRDGTGPEHIVHNATAESDIAAAMAKAVPTKDEVNGLSEER